MAERGDIVSCTQLHVGPTWDFSNTATRIRALLTNSLAGAVGLNWDGTDLVAAGSTLTITGGVVTITALSPVRVHAPVFDKTDAGLATITDAATVRIDGAPTIAMGANVAISNAWSLLVPAGNVKFGGTVYFYETGGSILSIGGINPGEYLTRVGNVVTSAPLGASWDITLVRYYLIDYDGGSDSNIGYIDDVGGAVLVPAGKALKTIERFFEIFPKYGNGRVVTVLIKNRVGGATYLRKDGITDDYMNFSGVVGYRSITRRGSTDLTNSATDGVLCGAITAIAGPNPDGSFTCLAGGTTSVFTAAAGVIGAEPAAIGYRVRFKGNITAALANQCRAIAATSGLQLTTDLDLSNAPAAGDDFFIEEPGVRIARYRDVDEIHANAGAYDLSDGVTGLAGAITVGIGWTATTANSFRMGPIGGCRIAFCNQVNAPASAATNGAYGEAAAAGSQPTMVIANNYGGYTVGVGLRLQSSTGLLQTNGATFNSIFNVRTGATTTITLISASAVALNGGYFAGDLTVTSTSECTIGPTSLATTRAPRITSGGQLIIGGNKITVNNINVTNAGAKACVRISNTAPGQSVVINGVTGTTGNTGYGIDVSSANLSQIILGTATANTASGTLGEVRAAGATFLHTHFTRESVVDSNGNTIRGTGGMTADLPYRALTADAAIEAYRIVRRTATGVIKAQADSVANAANVIGAAQNAPVLGATAAVVTDGVAVLDFGADPTAPADVYLDATTAGRVTTTAPAPTGTNQILRIGQLVTALGGGSGLGLVQIELEATPDYMPVDIQLYGFTNPAQTTMSFNDGTYTFTLTDVGAGWSYYRAGGRYTISGNKTCTLPGAPGVPATGTYFIYIDATNGTLTCDAVGWTLLDTKVPVAVIFWNNTKTPKYHLFEERHTCLIDRRYHYEHHFTEGSEWISGGTPYIGAPGGAVPLSSDVDANKAFGIDQATFCDEDIINTLAQLAPPGGVATAYTIYYRTAASTWTWQSSNMPFRYTAASYIEWDNGGTMTTGANARYYNSYIVITNSYAGIADSIRFSIIPGRGEYLSLSAAQAESPAAFTLSGYNFAESVFLYQCTWLTNAGYAGSGKCVLAAAPKLIKIQTAAGAIVVPSHNLLSGLQGGDLVASEFYHLTAAQWASVTAGTATQVLYYGASGYPTSEAAFTYDATNNRLTVENAILNGAAAVATTALGISPTKSVAAAAGAIWRGFHVEAGTLTITGASILPTLITAFNTNYFGAPTITSVNAQTVTDASTVYIANAPTASAGGGSTPTLTNAYALLVDAGNVRIDAGLMIAATAMISGTDITIGNTTPASTATPRMISLGGTYADAAGVGSKLKLKIFDNGATLWTGLGTSANQFDYFAGTGFTHVFYIQTNAEARISASYATFNRLSAATDSTTSFYYGPIATLGGTTAAQYFNAYYDSVQTRYETFTGTSNGAAIKLTTSAGNDVGDLSFYVSDNAAAAGNALTQLGTTAFTITGPKLARTTSPYSAVSLPSVTTVFAGNVAVGTGLYLTAPTFNNDGSARTITAAATAYVAGPPTGTATLTAAWSVLVADGNSRFAKQVKIGDSTTSDYATTGTLLRVDADVTVPFAASQFNYVGIVAHLFTWETSTGTVTAYRNVQIGAPTLVSSAGATTVTLAHALGIDGLVAGTDITITTAASLYVAAAPSVTAGTIGSAYSVLVDAGNCRFDGEVFVGGDYATTTTTQITSLKMELGRGSTGNINTTIQFHAQADASGTTIDYDARLDRASGVNGIFALQNSGTGTLLLRSGLDVTGGTTGVVGADIAFQTGADYAGVVGGDEKMRIADASVLIGVASGSTYQLLRVQQTGRSLTAAAGSTWSAVNFIGHSITVTGNTNITTTAGFNGNVIGSPAITFTGSCVITSSAALRIVGEPSFSGGTGSITNAYSVWVDSGVARFDGGVRPGDGSTYVFEFPADATGNTTNATGRVPIYITGVGMKYLRYFDS